MPNYLSGDLLNQPYNFAGYYAYTTFRASSGRSIDEEDFMNMFDGCFFE